MEQADNRQTEDPLQRYINYLRGGAKYGAASWLTGIIISLLLFREPPLNPGSGLLDANIDIVLADVPQWKIASYIYYGGHFVRVTPEDLMYGPQNLATYFGGIHLFAFLLPAIILLSAGYLHTRDKNPHTLLSARLYGASIVGAYAILMIIGIFFLNHHGSDDYGNQWAITLSFSRTLIFSIVYPIVFGSIGGQLAYTKLE